MKKILILIVIMLLAAFYWRVESIGLQVQALPNGATLEKTDCWFDTPLLRRVECAFMHTRQLDDLQQFKLPIVIVRNAWLSNDSSPVVYIQGGPGGSTGLDKETIKWWLTDIKDYAWGHDFIMYDQRGVGLSDPELSCPEILQAYKVDLQQPLQPLQEYHNYLAQVDICKKRLSKEGHHLNQLTTRINADDLSDMMQLIQQGEWILFGASYGTRVALEMERHYPQQVKSLILDSVYPHDKDGYLSWPELYASGVQRILDSVEKNKQTLRKSLRSALDQLEMQPQQLELKLYSGEDMSLVLTPSRFYSSLFNATYDPDLIGKIPYAIYFMATGNLDNEAIRELARFSLEIELDETFSDPVFNAVSCSEDMLDRQADYLSAVEENFSDIPQIRVQMQIQNQQQTCAAWGVGNSGTLDTSPVTTNKPVLLLAGEFDAVTPVRWANEMHAYLPNSQLVIVPRGSHGVTLYDQCTIDAARSFLQEPESAVGHMCQLSQ